MQYDLWHYQVQLRRIAAHREKGVEAEIRKAYQDVLIELQAILGKYYAGYGDPETSILTRGDLQAAGQYKNFLEDVLSHLDGLGEPMERKIRKTVEDTYTTCYTGMAAVVWRCTCSYTGNSTVYCGISDTQINAVYCIPTPAKTDCFRYSKNIGSRVSFWR